MWAIIVQKQRPQYLPSQIFSNIQKGEIIDTTQTSLQHIIGGKLI